ncbi:MAG: hypothetical protein CL917_09905 [Deltaproteobacteria bacterium]|nr:hypothetical protein [Deltaproteobacteria bacterium]
MARRTRKKQQPNSAAVTLDAIESRSDRLAQWIAENPLPILAVGAVILLIAAIWGFAGQENNEVDMAASAQLSEAQISYRTSMGAPAGAVEIPEPANPEAAQSIREQAIVDFDQVTLDHPGTIAAALAQLEAGKIAQTMGAVQIAQGHFQVGLENVPSGDSLRALFLVRLGSLYEVNQEWAQAASVYEEAGAMDNYPLRQIALADAIRSYLEAEDSDAAQRLAEQLQQDELALELPAYVQSQLSGLQNSEPVR